MCHEDILVIFFLNKDLKIFFFNNHIAIISKKRKMTSKQTKNVFLFLII